MDPRPRAPRARLPLAPVALLLGLSAAADSGAQAVLHEFIPPDPHEDVAMATTSPDGRLPAALSTPSGLVSAPDPFRGSGAERPYSGASTARSPDATFEPDRDTRNIDVEVQDDPFSPSTIPFKRLRAYDAVDPDYTLRVRDRALRPVPVGGTLAAGEEPFFGDLVVDLLPAEAIRIPSVGPGARVLKLHVSPAVPLEILRDGADNWFVRSPRRERVRLILELSVARATFGSPFPDVAWDELRGASPLPVGPAAAAAEVHVAIGVSRAMRPREVVARLVDYFRSFVPSSERPEGHGDIYLDLALTQRGVCRHRAFAFLVTALGLGLPSRLVLNEAHAWVEVHDGSLWRRIDLGGAALGMDLPEDDGRPVHRPPDDPFPWPATSEPAEALASRERAQAPGAGAAGSAPDGGGAATPAAPSPFPDSVPADPARDDRAAATLTLALVGERALRGVPLQVRGVVSAGGRPCAGVRVDLRLALSGEGREVTIGSVSTDEHGAYDGAVVVPRETPVGYHDLIATTPGDARCGPGRTPSP